MSVYSTPPDPVSSVSRLSIRQRTDPDTRSSEVARPALKSDRSSVLSSTQPSRPRNCGSSRSPKVAEVESPMIESRASDASRTRFAL